MLTLAKPELNATRANSAFAIQAELEQNDELSRLAERVHALLAQHDGTVGQSVQSSVRGKESLTASQLRAFLNVAALFEPAALRESERALCERLFAVNTFAPFQLARLLLPALVRCAIGKCNCFSI